MYNITKFSDHLRIVFNHDFNLTTMNAVIHHETMLAEYPYTNDLWVFGSHHADIRLGELDTMVSEFNCRCPKNASRKKTAIVAEQGLTRAILELWINGLKKKVAFEIRMFTSLDEAETWLELENSKVA